MGFELNPYDMCVANANIKGKQCTVFWYVDDNKIIHVDPKVVNKVIEIIEETFGKMPLTTRDKRNFSGHEYKIQDKKVKTGMKKYI